MKYLLKIFFIFLLLVSPLFARSIEDISKKLPPHLVLGQEQKWERFQLKILTNQKKISLVFPLEIYIVAYNPDLDLSFTGNISLAIESLSARSYRETTLKESDQIAPGIYKIVYPFEQVGEYKIRANFVALDGAFTQIETSVQVDPCSSLMQYQKNIFMMMIIVGIAFVVVYLARRIKK
ncbi:MAG: hypothetical protein HQM15_03485 [Deltaproteobacteria bacterium]|nr:hypothetical protein [Deltaproteobacteria bacterium]